jgi:hypothetical protein
MVAKVEKNPLKKVAHVEDAIAATLDHFNPGLGSIQGNNFRG